MQNKLQKLQKLQNNLFDSRLILYLPYFPVVYLFHEKRSRRSKVGRSRVTRFADRSHPRDSVEIGGLVFFPTTRALAEHRFVRYISIIARATNWCFATRPREDGNRLYVYFHSVLLHVSRLILGE